MPNNEVEKWFDATAFLGIIAVSIVGVFIFAFCSPKHYVIEKREQSVLVGMPTPTSYPTREYIFHPVVMPTATVQSIDNYCFIDRECITHEQWVQGFCEWHRDTERVYWPNPDIEFRENEDCNIHKENKVSSTTKTQGCRKVSYYEQHPVGNIIDTITVCSDETPPPPKNDRDEDIPNGDGWDCPIKESECG